MILLASLLLSPLVLKVLIQRFLKIVRGATAVLPKQAALLNTTEEILVLKIFLKLGDSI